MADLTAWVPLWEREPALVPAPWFNSGNGVWMRYAPGSSRVPSEAQADDLAAQIGCAVQWLHEHDCLTLVKSSDPTVPYIDSIRAIVEHRLGNASPA